MLIQSLRPQTFSQVVGNSLNNKILLSLARNFDTAPSTIILQGSFGSGKTTTSRLFAKALNCKNLQKNDICGKCQSCLADLNSVPWYNEFDSTAMGNIESIKELRDMFISTAKGYNKVIVLDECHTISRQGQSALLKVFEETPKGVFFILPTTDPDKLLPTIRSRSLELVYTSKTIEEVKANIAYQAGKMNIPITQAVIDLIAIRSRGIMRNAHMLLDKFSLLGEEEFVKSEIPTVELLNKYLVSILKRDKDSVLESVSELSRIPVSYLKEDWQDYFLNLIKASIDPSLVHNQTQIKLSSALGQSLVPLVRDCTQDWVIKSFQSSVQSQTAMLALFQILTSKNK